MEQIPSFNEIIEKSIVNNWERDALSDYKGATLQYHDVARKIEKLHILFESSGVEKGDKIAICGRNSAHCDFSGYDYIRSGRRTNSTRIYTGTDI